MAGLNSLDEITLLRAADILWDAQRLLGVPLGKVIEALGWTVLNDDLGGLVRLDPGFGLTEGRAAVGSDGKGQVISIMVDVCDVSFSGADEVNAFRQDVFAEAGAVLAAAYGPPTDRVPGAEPELWWRRGDAVLELSIGWYSVTLRVLPAALADNPEG